MTGGASSTIVTALERTWAEIRDKHPDVPDAVIVSGKGRKGMQVTWGRWHSDLWSDAHARSVTIPELFVAGECLAQGPEKVLETLIHEASHGVADTRKIKDTSRGNRYHNQKFVAIAEELGLKGPETPHTIRGWSACRLAEGTVDTYESFAALRDAIVVVIGARLEIDDEAEAPTRAPQPKYECGCEGRYIRMSKKVYDEGTILCGICTEPFLEVVAV